jgi:4-hydroxybenzoate polyprenyltransferase
MSRYRETEVTSPVLGYLELLRLPNLFTAVADVAMGFLFVQLGWLLAEPEVLRRIEWWVLGLLAAASAMLYASGVVLNDVFDVEVDRKERPERPLPSGRVSLRAARWIGWELLLWGTVLAWAASLVARNMWQRNMTDSLLIQFRPGIVATLLAGLIVAYDAGLKRTPVGPLAMGGCRMLNVLLGMSVLPGAWAPEHWLVAGAIGTYITGVTWFARDEATRSSQSQLVAATAVMLAGVGLLAWLPQWIESGHLRGDPTIWYIAMALVGVRIGLRCAAALQNPVPAQVREAVGQAILSLVVLDAAVCFAVRGLYPALLVLVLIVPTVFLGRWIQPT